MLLLLCVLPCTLCRGAKQGWGPSAPLHGYLRPRVPARPLTWCLYQGKTLKYSVNRWTQRAGWTLQWQFPYDYPIVVTTCFKGSFLQAIQALTQAYNRAEHPFYLDLYPRQQLAVIGDQSHENF